MSESRGFSPSLQGSPSLPGQTKAHTANSTPWRGMPPVRRVMSGKTIASGSPLWRTLLKGQPLFDARTRIEPTPPCREASVLTKQLASQMVELAIRREEIFRTCLRVADFPRRYKIKMLNFKTLFWVLYSICLNFKQM